MTREEKVQYWVGISKDDFVVAEILFKNGQNRYAGFMCHQAIEKIFKGYFAKVKNDTPPYGHNLTLLAQKSELYDLLDEVQITFLTELNPLNIEARYPDYKNKVAKALSDEKMQKFLIQTKELLQWTIEKL